MNLLHINNVYNLVVSVNVRDIIYQPNKNIVKCLHNIAIRNDIDLTLFGSTKQYCQVKQDLLITLVNLVIRKNIS